MGTKFGDNDSGGSFGMTWGSPGELVGSSQVPGRSFGDTSFSNEQCWYFREWTIQATFERGDGCGSAKPPTPPQPPGLVVGTKEYDDYWNRVAEGEPIKGEWSGFMTDNRWCECIKVDPPYSYAPANIPPPKGESAQAPFDTGRALDNYDKNIGPNGGGTRTMMMRTVKFLCKDCPTGEDCKCKPSGKGEPTITRIDPCSSEVGIELMQPHKQTREEQSEDGVYPGEPPCGSLGEGVDSQ